MYKRAKSSEQYPLTANRSEAKIPTEASGGHKALRTKVAKNFLKNTSTSPPLGGLGDKKGTEHRAQCTMLRKELHK
jgi:hypothetical protein